MNLKQRLPLLRWSAGGWPWAVARSPGPASSATASGGRAAEYVESHARRGDVDDALATIDKFAYEKSMLMNVGDEVYADDGVRRLSAWTGNCGYSALPAIARAAPAAKVFSVEFSAANAEIARRIWSHAGVEDRVTCVVGTIGDGGTTLDALAAEHGFSEGCLDFVFVDHDKNAYLPDLLSILDRGWLHPGAIVVADNVGVPGSPNTAPTCASSRANTGTPSSTRRMSSTRG